MSKTGLTSETRLGWQGPYPAKHWIFKNDDCTISLGPCARCWSISWEFHQLEFLLLQHIYWFVFSTVTPGKDLGFPFSRQSCPFSLPFPCSEWTDLTTAFLALRHCSHPFLMHNMVQPSDHLVYCFQSCPSCIAEPQDRQRILDAFSKYQTGIVIVLD